MACAIKGTVTQAKMGVVYNTVQRAPLGTRGVQRALLGTWAVSGCSCPALAFPQPRQPAPPPPSWDGPSTAGEPRSLRNLLSGSPSLGAVQRVLSVRPHAVPNGAPQRIGEEFSYSGISLRDFQPKRSLSVLLHPCCAGLFNFAWTRDRSGCL